MDDRAKPINIFFIVLRVGIGGLFIISGTMKILDPLKFLTAIETFHLLPYSIAYIVAYFLPWVEIISGLALILNKGQKSALIILTTLITVFIIALVLSWGRGLDIVCGCFGHPKSIKTIRLAQIRMRTWGGNISPRSNLDADIRKQLRLLPRTSQTT